MLCLRVWRCVRAAVCGGVAGAVGFTVACVRMAVCVCGCVAVCVWRCGPVRVGFTMAGVAVRVRGGAVACVWPAMCAGKGGRGGPPFVVCRRRCPTLPHPGGCSTIGAGSLSFRVRKGRPGVSLPLWPPPRLPGLIMPPPEGRVWDSGIA